MSPEVQVVVLLLHLVAMLFMAAPLYALLAVNERGRFTIPPNYNVTFSYMTGYVVAIFMVAAALFAWRAYRRPVPWGCF